MLTLSRDRPRAVRPGTRSRQRSSLGVSPSPRPPARSGAASHPGVLGAVAERTPLLSAVLADDGNGSDVALWKAAEVVGQAEHGLLRPLPLAGAALHLQVHFVDHPQPGGADRVAEALEATIDLAGNFAVGVIKGVEHILDGAALGGDVQILHGDEFGHREAVVHLD